MSEASIRRCHQRRRDCGSSLCLGFFWLRIAGCVAAPLSPMYIRGEAYLQLHNGVSAATEFQKITEHKYVIGNFPLGALAHLGLGRAYALTGDAAKARVAYQDFLALWKDADPDIPVLKEAKAEYAKLQ